MYREREQDDATLADLARRPAPGYGDPAAGYGPGGVTNPAYQNGQAAAQQTRNPALNTPALDRASVQPPADPAAPPVSQNTRDWRDQMRTDARGRQAVGALSGIRFDDDYNGDVKARTSVKNTFGTIARDYPNTPEGLKALVNDPRFKAAFPNAKVVGFDKIDFGGVLSDFETGSPVGIVDVGEAFDEKNNTGKAWWWGVGDGPATPTVPTLAPDASLLGTQPAGPPIALDTGSRDALVNPFGESNLLDLAYLYRGENL